MHLENHVYVGVLARQPIVDAYHGALDDIRRSALHGCVDGGALGVLATLRVARLDFRKIEPASEHGLDVTLLAREFPSAIHVGAHTGITLEVAVHVLLRLRPADAELLAETERGHAVDQAEVNGLGHPALLVANRFRVDAEDLSRGRAVNIPPFGKGSA